MSNKLQKQEIVAYYLHMLPEINTQQLRCTVNSEIFMYIYYCDFLNNGQKCKFNFRKCHEQITLIKIHMQGFAFANLNSCNFSQ